ncbi:hypothetical protein LC574_34875 [Nostoc sp. CHAB 5715]|nr:hypothetical protein [Nostoc sp. CHAB 5715]
MRGVNFVSSFIVIWYFVNFHLLKLGFSELGFFRKIKYLQSWAIAWRVTGDQLAYNMDVADITIKNIASSKIII